MSSSASRTIAVVAGAGEPLPGELEVARDLGVQIAEAGFCLLVPAEGDLNLEVAITARQGGAHVVGISPGTDRDDHFYRWGLPLDAHDVLLYTGLGTREGQILAARSAEGLIVVPTSKPPLWAMGAAAGANRPVGFVAGQKQEIAKALRALGFRAVVRKHPANLIRALGRDLLHPLKSEVAEDGEAKS